MSLLHTQLAEVIDPDLKSLVGELSEITMAPAAPGVMVLHFLQSCHHPWGANDKWQRIEKDRITPGRFLDRKIGKLDSPVVLQLCREIALMNGLSIEVVERMSLYEFFNKYTPHPLKKQTKKRHNPGDTLRRLGY